MTCRLSNRVHAGNIEKYRWGMVTFIFVVNFDLMIPEYKFQTTKRTSNIHSETIWDKYGDLHAG